MAIGLCVPFSLTFLPFECLLGCLVCAAIAHSLVVSFYLI